MDMTRALNRAPRGRLAIAAIVLAMLGVTGARASAQQRVVTSFDAGWKFHLGDVSHGENPSFDDSAWRPLDLPHDWSIEGEFSAQNPAGASGGALPGGIGWYRKSFVIPA